MKRIFVVGRWCHSGRCRAAGRGDDRELFLYRRGFPPAADTQFGGQALEVNGSCWQVPLLGGVFVGVGVGLIVRQGGSSGGDDALPLSSIS